MRQLAGLKSRLEPFEKLLKTQSDIEELLQLLELEPDKETEHAVIEMATKFVGDLDAYELLTLLNGPHDASPAIVEIGAGAGGTEACDWASMLFRMYLRWAQRGGYKLEILSETPGDVTGYRNISFEVSGPMAYGYMKAEHGVHRLVRISPFDASSRRHTSFAVVSVMPEVEPGEVNLRTEDVDVETFRASGAGGQHVNKTESAVRIIHRETGIVINCQNERSQLKNKETAMRMLASRLAELEKDKTEEKLKQLRGEANPADWGHQIRSYVMQPYTMVKDLRTSHETGNIIAVMDGEIEGFISAYLRLSPDKQ